MLDVKRLYNFRVENFHQIFLWIRSERFGLQISCSILSSTLCQLEQKMP